MTLQERIADTKARLNDAIEQRKQLNAAVEQSERALLRLDAELALLERMAKDEEPGPHLAVVS